MGNNSSQRAETKQFCRRTSVPASEASLLGRRPTNEDRHLIIQHLPKHPHCAMFAIFDGHNGDTCADFCSNNFPNSIDEHVKGGKVNRSAMTEIFLKVDEDFWHHIEAQPVDAGCTAVVAFYNRVRRYLSVANCGDARCVLSRKRTAIKMSIDHRPSVPSERQRIENAGVTVYDNRVDGVLAVSRAMGDHSFKRDHAKNKSKAKMPVTALPDFKSVDITDDDEFLILACDGLWDVMTDQEAVDYVWRRLKEEQMEDLSELRRDKKPKANNINANTVSVVVNNNNNNNSDEKSAENKQPAASNEHKNNQHNHHNHGSKDGFVNANRPYDPDNPVTSVGANPALSSFSNAVQRLVAKDIAQELGQAAINQGSTDNVTVLICFLNHVQVD